MRTETLSTAVYSVTIAGFEHPAAANSVKATFTSTATGTVRVLYTTHEGMVSGLRTVLGQGKFLEPDAGDRVERVAGWVSPGITDQ